MRPDPLGQNVDMLIFILSDVVSRLIVAESILATSVIPSAPPLSWM